MKTTKNKARNKRFARKRALRKKYGIDDQTVKRDSIQACKRGWGRGISK